MALSSDRRQSRGRRGGCCGCMSTLLLLLLLVVAAGAALYFKVPQKLGLIQSATAAQLSKTPDRGAAAALLQDLAAHGVDTAGMDLWVLPYLDGSGVAAYAVLDGAEGFSFPQSASDPVIGFMTELASGALAQEYGVKRVAIEYRMGEEAALIKLTASTQNLQGFALGKITRKQLLKAVEGEANLAALALGGGQ